MQRFCRGIHACEIPVLDLDTDPDARKIITQACRNAVESDGSDAVVLGCAGMADMCSEISAELGVPVVDGVSAATLIVRSLVTMGLRTSARGEYAPPPPKAYKAG
jgi:allantoin racemase